jgi:hypothetical protein
VNRVALLLLLAAAGPAWGQFQLYLVNGSVEQPVAQAYNCGNVEPGGSLTLPFRIRNVSAATATLDLLTVTGSGFSLSNANSLPLSLDSQKSIDFAVVFRSNGAGTYSAALDSVGISAILTATVPVELTADLATSGGLVSLVAGGANFGSVARGSTSTVQVVLVNQTDVALAAPQPTVAGAGFALSGALPGGTLVQPTASVQFSVQFSPSADGVAAGQLSLGDRTYPLTGTGVEPPLPQPRISLALPQVGSAQQGSLAINLATPSQTSGSGTVSLTFLPAAPLASTATDAGIAFASGGQSATFTVSAGDTQGHFGSQLSALFQTGTTAGTLTVAVQLGSNSDQQAIAILPAVVGVTAAQGVRSTSAVEVDLTGFDNTRSAGALAFTFFDAGGNALAPPIQTDGTANFASYFQSASDGTFALKAVFPVVGDTSQIKAFQAVVTNSAGTQTTAKTSF